MDRLGFARLSSAALVAGALSLVLLGSSIRGGERTGSERSSRPVNTIRVPHGGIQPQIALDAKGILHMVYFEGDSGHGDLYYVHSADLGTTFSDPVKVNSHPGSAIAAGNIRGAHIALGRDGRVYVAWNGTYELDRPGVTKPWMKHPMLFSRLNDSKTGFEPERNVIHASFGLDGGGAVAADHAGNVYVFWHAPAPGTEGEANRQVWVARSRNDGQTFEAEKPAFDQKTGACGCCGMDAFADRKNNLYVLYRSATEMVHRDMYLLESNNHGETFRGTNISQWNIGACTMSMENFSEGPAGVLASWETMGNVFFGVINPSTGRMSAPVAAPSSTQKTGEALKRKYPVVVANAQGETMLAWAEGMGWGKGGSLAWQVYDKNGQPVGDTGHASGVPAWSLVAAFTRPDGGFTLVY